MEDLPFRDRAEGGLRLATHVLPVGGPDPPVVLALARGGLPAGRELARALHAELDVFCVQRVGVPWQPELTMGAVTASAGVLDEEVLATLHLPPERIDFALARERAELRRREALYRPAHRELDIRGRAVLLVDDGAATGSSMVAALRSLRARKPRSLRVALPVASHKALQWIERESDGYDCLATPEPFGSIGNWYLDFRPVSDHDVMRTLELVGREHANGKRRKELR
jgi:putative phosphoribosyl transferase